MNEIEKSHSRGRRKTVIGLDPILAGFWLANMGRQPGNTVALVGWGLGIKWVNMNAVTGLSFPIGLPMLISTSTGTR